MSASLFSDGTTLSPGIRSRFVENGNGLTVHVLEAGYEPGNRPCVLLLHGFPELAYSWRKVMLPIAEAGYHVIAPDQRGFGRTTGWSADYDGDLHPFTFLNLVRDAIGLLYVFGHRSVAGVVGHDFGSPVAACCALTRPDIFRSLVMMSAPFMGAPDLPFGTARDGKPPGTVSSVRAPSIHDDLAALRPPRKHYQWYYSTREANDNMQHCSQGVHAFLRAYFHFKSADYKDNLPFELKSWTAAELAKLPTYYVMPLEQGMAETVAPQMPSAAQIASCTWLPEDDLQVFSTEFGRTGFQGGLQWYRCGTTGLSAAGLTLFAGRAIQVPATFLSGAQDWGPYQVAGALKQMAERACSQYRGSHFIEGAGHWVQQEQPGEVSRRVIQFLQTVS